MKDVQAKIKQFRSENPFIGSRELVYKIILNAILSGEITPQEKINQSVLADEFSMSRTPVKEALNLLEDDGFIERTGSSAFYNVKKFDMEDFIDFSELRLVLEPTAAYYAARYINDSGIERLEKCLQIQEKLAAEKDMAGLIFNHTEFHKIIVEESQNRYLIEIYDRYEKKSLFFNRSIMSSENTKYNLTKHRLIADKIIQHCELEAMEEMKVHLSFYARSAVKKML